MRLQGPSEASSAILHNRADTIVLSIIIPAKNEASMIGRCLDAVANQSLSPSQLEVIVVDNGSSDGTVEIANSFASRIQVQVVHKHGGYVSAVRNAGADVARGGIIAFLDADCLIGRNWAEQAIDTLRDPNIGAVGGPVLPAGSTWVARSWFDNAVVVKVGKVKHLGTAALALRREVFEHIGRFDEALETNEDFELCLRVRQEGLSIYSVPALAVTHLRTPETLKQFFLRERWHGTHVFRVFLNHVGELANVKAVGFSFFTLFCLIGIIVGAYCSVKGSASLLIASALLLLAVCILLTIRMLRKHHSEPTLNLFVSLLVLHLAYGIARASSLLRARTWIRNPAGHKRLKSSSLPPETNSVHNA